MINNIFLIKKSKFRLDFVDQLPLLLSLFSIHPSIHPSHHFVIICRRFNAVSIPNIHLKKTQVILCAPIQKRRMMLFICFRFQ